MENKFIEMSLTGGITFLLIFSVLTPTVIGYIVRQEKLRNSVELPEITGNSGLIDSAWPMKCHDLNHTGRSQYSTIDNLGIEKWRFKTEIAIEGSPVIGDEGIIYIGSFDGNLYALFPNGTMKWKYNIGGWIWSSPAIDENGTIYVGSDEDYLHAIYPNGTMKWKFLAHDSIYCSPAIGNDGTIYFGILGPGTDKGRVYAVRSNGTEKWHYDTGYYVISDPAIGNDGTIYIGSGDKHLYAIYPNGTLRWRFKTGDYVKGPPSIAEDGTIYIGSFDGNLYALFPNGTEKWKCGIGSGTRTNPSIAEDGTIYIGNDKLYAIYSNGTRRWAFDLGRDRFIDMSSPAISADGTIYIGTTIDESYGGELIAVNPDGTEKWRSKNICTNWIESSPAIDEDGTLYVGSSSDEEIRPNVYIPTGHLHAFGPGQAKHINIDEPQLGWLYILGRRMLPTLFGRTIFIGNGNIKIRISASVPEEVEQVSFRLKSCDPFISNAHQQWIKFIDDEPPYEWIVDISNLEYRLCNYNLEVVASYFGGCEWTEEMDILIFHLRKN